MGMRTLSLALAAERREDASMTGINYGRVILGGLAAGVVANACDVLTGMFLMADDMQRMARRLNLDPMALNSPSVAVTWVVVDFIYALLIVWTYAAIRPRLGPGPGTAVKAGLVIYAAVTVVLFGFVGMGVFTPDTFLKSSALSLVTVVLTSLTGGYVYKET
jgi:hypothetical protein